MSDRQRKPRIGPLGTVGDLVNEMAKVYRQARRDEIEIEAARKELGPAWCRRHSTTSELTVVRVSARKRID